jgi:hypothetical protein
MQQVAMLQQPVLQASLSPAAHQTRININSKRMHSEVPAHH